MTDEYEYDPKTAFGDVDLIARLSRKRKKAKETKVCPLCEGRASLENTITGLRMQCPSCKGKGKVK